MLNLRHAIERSKETTLEKRAGLSGVKKYTRRGEEERKGTITRTIMYRWKSPKNQEK